ncbi:MAG TPA: hypothetical protein VFF67_00830 [Thermoplasmata archaeon]|nr:hypothetical protein [Thermoplasmata archaeon]
MGGLLVLVGVVPPAASGLVGVSSFPATSATPTNFTYSATCSGGYYIVRPQWSFSWLDNGTPIPNASSTQYCAWSGSGTRPANANGLSARIEIFVSPGVYASKSTTKSFAVNHSVSVKLTVSLTLKPPSIFCFSGKHCSQKVTESLLLASP